jgi:hypothetical protein
MQDDKIAAPDDQISNAYPAPEPPRRVRTMIILLLFAFMIGLGAMAWMLSSWRDARALLIVDTPAQQPSQAEQQPIELAPTMPTPALRAAPAGDLEQRIADLDARLARIDRGASLASQNALRAERLLIAFAARRALDRGLALGYLEGQLNSHFGSAEPRAVSVITTAARDPATLLQLSAELEALKPTLVGGAASSDWWGNIQDVMGRLVVVREAGSQSAAPLDRFAEAKALVGSGRVDLALETITRMPGSAGASTWITRARRYIEASRALDLLEEAALAEANAPVPPAGVGLVMPENRL